MNATDHNQEGLAMLDADPRRAVDAFREAIRLDPSFFDAYLNMTAALLKLLRRDEAVQALEAAVALNNKDDEALFFLASLSGNTGRSERAVQVWKQYIEMRPDQTTAYLSLAANLLKLGRIGEAIEAKARYVALNPTPEAHADLGATLVRNGRPTEALAAFENAKNAAPDFFIKNSYEALLYAQAKRAAAR